MGFENFDGILDFAIEKEQEAADFYSMVARHEDLPGSREMFEEFASEELKHKKMLENMKKTGNVEESLKGYRFKWITDIKRSDYLIDIEFHHGMNYREILHLAMKREEKALKFYGDLREKAEDDNAKKLFNVLCQEEAKHKLSLESIYDDFMANLGD
jgi:rubrerythrin